MNLLVTFSEYVTFFKVSEEYCSTKVLQNQSTFLFLTCMLIRKKNRLKRTLTFYWIPDWFSFNTLKIMKKRLLRTVNLCQESLSSTFSLKMSWKMKIQNDANAFSGIWFHICWKNARDGNISSLNIIFEWKILTEFLFTGKYIIFLL